jgi:acetyl esterase/lipase
MVVAPPEGPANGKAVIWIVSAGWTSDYNWVNMFRSLVKPVSDRGYTIFFVMHGSQPKYTVPEAVADIKRAVRFIRYHAKEYEIDSNHIGISGASAGGHLSLVTGTADDSINARAKDPVDRVSSLVQAVACFFPPVDFLNWKETGDNAVLHSTMKEFQASFDFTEWNPKTLHYIPISDSLKRTQIGKSISPLYFVTAGDAPTLIVHGDSDKVVPLSQSQKIIDKFIESNVPCALKIKNGADHGFWNDMTSYAAMFADWFDQYLK